MSSHADLAFITGTSQYPSPVPRTVPTGKFADGYSRPHPPSSATSKPPSSFSSRNERASRATRLPVFSCVKVTDMGQKTSTSSLVRFFSTWKAVDLSSGTHSPVGGKSSSHRFRISDPTLRLSSIGLQTIQNSRCRRHIVSARNRRVSPGKRIRSYGRARLIWLYWRWRSGRVRTVKWGDGSVMSELIGLMS